MSQAWPTASGRVPSKTVMTGVPSGSVLTSTRWRPKQAWLPPQK